MGYRDPKTVIAPQNRWTPGDVLCNTGQGGWSVTEGLWDGNAVLALRWNGDDDSGSGGNPQSHGNPTWFILPAELGEAVRGAAFRLNEAMTFVTYEITQPPGFDDGVFKVRLSVEGRLRDIIAGRDIRFDIPRLANRFFRQEAEFLVPPEAKGSPMRGRLRDGAWEGTVQTNGMPEADNPTSMDVVRDAIIANVMRVLEPWKPREFPPATTHHLLRP